MEGRTLDEDTLMRISFLTGIFNALNICCGQGSAAECWVTVRNQNLLFAGEAPVDYMIQHGLSGMEPTTVPGRHHSWDSPAIWQMGR